jgi:predicted glycosyltransferase
VTVLPEAGLSGVTMAAAIRAGLAGPDPGAMTVAVDGAARSAEIIQGLIRRRA